MKKLLMILMILACLSLLLTACADDLLEPSAATTESGEPAQTPTEEPTEEVTEDVSAEAASEQLDDGKMNPDASYGDIYPLP